MEILQDVIRRLDPREIELGYFSVHPVCICEMEERRDKTVGEFLDAMLHDIRDILDRAKGADIPAPSGKRGILFVHKSIDGDAGCGRHDVAMVYKEDLFDIVNIDTVPIYDCESMSAEEMLGCYVADAGITKANEIDVVVTFLHRALMEKEQADCESCPWEELADISYKDFIQSFELTPDGDYPGEKELRFKCDVAMFRYGRYCRCVELEKIRQSCMNVRE